MTRTIKKKAVKKIKAWLILSDDGVFSHVTTNKKDADSWEECKVVPCTITYTL